MSEKLIIKNFGGLKEATIELNSINIFIGEQVSGKSITAKLFYFFKNIPDEIFEGVSDGKLKKTITSDLVKKFENYFPVISWPDLSFYIRYEIGVEYIELTRQKKTSKKLDLVFSEQFTQSFKDCRKILKTQAKHGREQRSLISLNVRQTFYNHLVDSIGGILRNNQIFLPAGRSFFANFNKSFYTRIARNDPFDPFIVEFGSFYELYKSRIVSDLNNRDTVNKDQPRISSPIRQLINEIIGANVEISEGNVYLLHKDGRRVELLYASSGQQETLPLSLMLAFFSMYSYVSGGTTVYIEEPEAHLFPTAQKRIVELIANVFNTQNSDLQFVITTHSPYILTSFNNLIEAGNILRTTPKKEKVYKIVPKSEVLISENVSAYAMKSGKVENLKDKSTKLISARVLDDVSEEIAIQFDKLLEI